jgi:predicted nucleotidyltransferase
VKRGGVLRFTLVSSSVAEALRRSLAGRSDLRFAVLFGSCAQGRERPESDVDLAIVPSGAFSLVDEGDLARSVAQATGRELDLVRLDRTEDIILRREIAHGVLVGESVPGGFARFRGEAIVEWLDFEPVYTRATELYLRRVAEGVR